MVVEVSMDSPVESVTALGDETGIAWRMDESTLTVEIEQVAYHLLLVVE